MRRASTVRSSACRGFAVAAPRRRRPAADSRRVRTLYGFLSTLLKVRHAPALGQDRGPRRSTGRGGGASCRARCSGPLAAAGHQAREVSLATRSGSPISQAISGSSTITFLLGEIGVRDARAWTPRSPSVRGRQVRHSALPQLGAVDPAQERVGRGPPSRRTPARPRAARGGQPRALRAGAPLRRAQPGGTTTTLRLKIAGDPSASHPVGLGVAIRFSTSRPGARHPRNLDMGDKLPGVSGIIESAPRATTRTTTDAVERDHGDACPGAEGRGTPPSTSSRARRPRT